MRPETKKETFEKSLKNADKFFQNYMKTHFLGNSEIRNIEALRIENKESIGGSRYDQVSCFWLLT